MNDTDLLSLVAEERKRSIGFDHDEELADAREQALNYVKGEMADVPTQPNRSKAVSTDVADAIETVLPDLIEIFVGGEDVAAFVPQGEEDEEGARQETDYLNHVVFQQNPGFLTFYSAFKDALTEKTGVFTWWWEDGEEVIEEFDDKDAMEVEAAAQRGELIDLAGDDEVGLYSYKLKTQRPGKVCVASVAPADFTCAPETVELAASTYSATRERVRAQELVERGYDRAKVDELSPYAAPSDEMDQARDRAGESDLSKAGGNGDMRMVEIVQHFIRVLDGEKIKLWRVVTGNGEKVLLEKEEVERVRIATLTPYIVPHRQYGESVYDKLGQIQQIKTVLWRMLLDSGYFALNQRHEVAMNMANEWTISDLLRNEPNMPVRVAQSGAVKPLTAGGLNFDAFAALEQASVMGEQRSGIVRNAQGLNPETLHDTAKGMEKLFSAAQRRVRLIARIFAETGVKDMFLGVHAMLRKYGTAAAKVRLRGKWVEVDPTAWGERNDMSIEVGLGASGKDAELAAADAILTIQEKVIQLQGGIEGPFVNKGNVHAALTRFARGAGMKTPEMFFMDPSEAEQMPPRPPKPDPEMEKAKGQLMLEQEKAKGQLQLEQAKGEMSAQQAEQKAIRDHELAVAKMQADAELRRYQIDEELTLKRQTTEAELQMKRELLMAELQMKRETAYLNAEVARETGLAKVEASSDVSEVNTGGEPG